MKILLINDYGYPAGGTEIKLRHFRQALRERGHEVRLFTSNAGAASPEDIFADHTCPGSNSSIRILTQTFNPAAAFSLWRLLRAFQPDVVHVHMFLTQLSPAILRVLRNVPTLHAVTWYRCICPLGTKRLPDGTLCTLPQGRICAQNGCISRKDGVLLTLQRRLLNAWKAKAFDQVVAVSEAVRQRLLAEGHGVDQVIPNGVPVVPPRPPLSNPPLALYCGRLVPEKGVDILLRAFARAARKIPDARLLIAGEGPRADDLRKLAVDLGISERVEMTGHLDVNALAHRAETAWVQIVPSQWEEPFGLVAAEAMMRGTAVIATRYAGLAEQVVHGETGLLTPPGDADAMADAIQRILSDREWAETLGKAARERALAEYALDKFVDQFETLYQQLIHHA